MASYCTEKYERADTGAEKTVCWRQDKHVHDASFITTIKQKLGTKYGGTWNVRVNSYQSSNQSCPTSAEMYEDL